MCVCVCENVSLRNVSEKLSFELSSDLLLELQWRHHQSFWTKPKKKKEKKKKKRQQSAEDTGGQEGKNKIKSEKSKRSCGRGGGRKILKMCRLIGWLFGFYGISTFVGYSMSNPCLYQLSVLFQTIQFSMSTQFNGQNSSISSSSVYHKYQNSSIASNSVYRK